MKDKVFIAIDGNIRISLVTTKKLLAKAAMDHDMWPTAVKAFGRVCSITAIMGYQLKDNQKITAVISGDGPLGTIVVEANNLGHIRGYVSNQYVSRKSEKNVSEVALGVGSTGTFKIIKDLELKTPYVSEGKIISGEIVDEFNDYFSKSNQAPSGILISTFLDGDNYIKNAGAILFEFLPGYTDDDLARVEKSIQKINPLSEKLNKISIYNILVSNFPNAKILEEGTLKWKCHCNPDKIIEIAKLLTNKDLKEIKERIHIKCEYCATKYKIKKSALIKE